MAKLPAAVESLIHELTRLPGIGRRGAERIVTHLLESRNEQAEALCAALTRLGLEVRSCSRCGNWADAEECAICTDPRRADGTLCVVERPPDLLAFEQTGVFSGKFHVLGGTLSPLRGISPDELSIDKLESRVVDEGIREVVVATSPTVEGDATALYIAGRLKSHGVSVARIGVGLPLGASLGYADPGTLRLALEGRRSLNS